MDIVGCDNLWAEVDLLSAIVDMLRTFGLADNHFRIGISSRRLLADLLAALGVPQEAHPGVYAALDKREKLPPEAFHQAVLDAGLPSDSWESLQGFFSQTEILGLRQQCEMMGDEATRPALLESLTELETLLERLTALGYGACTDLDLGVVRGLAYYTGIVFEVFDAGKTLRAIAGGGRYDNLLSRLGGRQVSGVGFGMGDVVLAELLKEHGLLPSGRLGPDYFIVSFEKGLGPWQLAQTLRRKGKTVGLSLTGGKLKKQLSQADDSGAAQVIFFGSEKAADGQVECKNLATGEQALLAVEDL
jgi:histidyl-tRNA synthetase